MILLIFFLFFKYLFLWVVFFVVFSDIFNVVILKKKGLISATQDVFCNFLSSAYFDWDVSETFFEDTWEPLKIHSFSSVGLVLFDSATAIGEYSTVFVFIQQYVASRAMTNTATGHVDCINTGWLQRDRGAGQEKREAIFIVIRASGWGTHKSLCNPVRALQLNQCRSKGNCDELSFARVRLLLRTK